MPTASKPSAVAARKVADAIADQMPACLHPDFMQEVNAYLRKRNLVGLIAISDDYKISLRIERLS